MTHQSEKLNLWDRIWNRYRKEVADRGSIDGYYMGFMGTREYVTREWIEYRVIDRLTGSETLKREYLT